MIRSLQEALFELRAVRWVLALAHLCRASVFRALGRTYRAMDDFCWIARVSTVPFLSRIAADAVFREIGAVKAGGRNTIRESFELDSASTAAAAR